jgi:hypothetical protein
VRNPRICPRLLLKCFSVRFAIGASELGMGWRAMDPTDHAAQLRRVAFNHVNWLAALSETLRRSVNTDVSIRRRTPEACLKGRFSIASVLSINWLQIEHDRERNHSQR